MRVFSVVLPVSAQAKQHAVCPNICYCADKADWDEGVKMGNEFYNPQLVAMENFLLLVLSNVVSIKTINFNGSWLRRGQN